MTSLTANYDQHTRILCVTWAIDRTRSPQFSYSVTVFNIHQPSELLLSVADLAPQVRSVTLNLETLSPGVYTATVQLVDILDVVSSSNSTTFAVVPNPTKLLFTVSTITPPAQQTPSPSIRPSSSGPTNPTVKPTSASTQTPSTSIPTFTPNFDSNIASDFSSFHLPNDCCSCNGLVSISS